MKEQGQNQEEYWQTDEAIGEARFPGEPTTIRLWVHTAVEAYGGRGEIFPLRQPTGRRDYVQAQAYILEPDIRLAVGLYPQPAEQGAVGEVLSSQWESMRQWEIGACQGWYYPAEKTAVLWEAFLFDGFNNQPDPRQDEALATLWDGFERLLLERFPEATRVVTPDWEDIYELALWQGFLRMRDYEYFNERAFLKEVNNQ